MQTQSSLISSVVLGRSFSGPLKYSREDLIMLIYVLLLLYYVMNLVIMAPKKFAVFGDSYVSRQGRFGLQMHFGDGSKVKYFGLGGMRVGDVPTDLWDKLTRYRPNICLLHVGGNDIAETCVVKDLFDNVRDRVTELRELGCHVVVGEVLPRAENSLRNVSLKTFESVRTALNRKLRRVLKKNSCSFRYSSGTRLGQMVGYITTTTVMVSIYQIVV